MNYLKRVVFFGFLVLFVSSFGLLPPAQSHPPRAFTVEADVQEKFDNEGQAGYLIFFREKPNLSQAHSMGWKNRGQFVMHSLQNAADRSQSGVREYLNNHNVSYKAFWIDNIIVVDGSTRAVFDGLRSFPEIESIKARRTMTLHEPFKDEGAKASPAAVEPNISHVRANEVWGLGFTGSGIIVANIDTGVRYTHQSLVNQYRGNLGSSTFDHNYNWWDPSNVCGTPSSAPCDNNGHGTHTMGTIVGDDAGHVRQIGMAPGSKWIACKGCESNSCSDTALLGCAQFIAAPTNLEGASPNPDLRPHVVNNSWGGSPGDDWYQGYVDNWHAAGIYPVFSAGNSGPACGTAGSPGDYGNVTAVGAVNHVTNLPADFSSRGPGTFDDNVNGTPGLLTLKPQVSAPGVNICSAIPTNDSSYDCGYSGTSMAAPHVAGLVALVWNAAPCLARNYATTEAIIQNSATGLTEGSTCGGDPSGVPNNTTGYGLINALAAVQAAIAYCGPTGTLQGTVMDALTGQPIENASVSADGLSQTTDSMGQYLFALIPVGTYDVTSSADGYESLTASGLVVSENCTTSQDFVLKAGRLESNVPFIDIAMLPNTTAMRSFRLTNTGLIPASFETREKRRAVSFTSNINSDRHDVPLSQEPPSPGRAPSVSRHLGQSLVNAQTLLAGTKAYGIDLTLYQFGSFDTSEPNVWSLIGGISSDDFFAGDFLGDDFTKLYVIGCSTNQFASIDVDSASIVPVGISTPTLGESWSGMTSSDDGVLYAASTSCSSSTLYSINPLNGIATQIGPITNAPCVIDIAINSQGEMYGVDIVNDNLVKIDPATGAGTIIGPIGFDANYAQGMSFDRATGALYLAAYNTSAGGELRLADTITGNTMLIGPFPNNNEVDCLAFPSSGSVGWFSESPITGTIDSTMSTDVDVTFDSAGLATGTYGAELAIENTTPYGPVSVPLTLFVVSDSTKRFNLSVKKKGVNGGGGTVQSADAVINCGETCKASYYKGPRVLLSATANPGSTFVGWSPSTLNCPGTAPCAVAMDRKKSVKAVFVGDYSLTVLKKGNGTGTVRSLDGGIDCGSSCSTKYPVHTTVTLEAAPDRGMKFVKWAPSNLCPGSGTCRVALDKTRKVTAFFENDDTFGTAQGSVAER